MPDDIYPRQNDLLLTAWAAGFLDGEGTIAISRGQSRTGKAQHHLAVTVSQTGAATPECLVRFRDLFGGRIDIHKYYPSEPHRAPAWHWKGYARQATHLLEAMLPFLTVKREQAEVALEYRRKTRGLVGEAKVRLGEDYMMRLRELRRLERIVEQKPPRAFRGTQRKLNDKQVTAIRRTYGEGGISYTQLARNYGVSTSLICHVVLGDRYYPLSPGV